MRAARQSSEKRGPTPAEVAVRLRARYRDHAHYNKRNPFNELLYIICSVRTHEIGYMSTHRLLRGAFPRTESLSRATLRELERPLRLGGMSRVKAKMIRRICDVLRDRFGRVTLAPLKRMSDAECEEFLTTLPGVGKKVARCVMLLALDRQVFPVDIHVWRVSRRLGWIRSGNGYATDEEMDLLQESVPPELRFSLHVNMLSLGRESCRPERPQCATCVLRDVCPSNVR